MRRLLFTAVFAICTLCLSAQPSSFYNLDLGASYIEDDFIHCVGEKYFVTKAVTQNGGIEITSYIFDGPDYKGEKISRLILSTIQERFFNATFIFGGKDNYGTESFEEDLLHYREKYGLVQRSTVDPTGSGDGYISPSLDDPIVIEINKIEEMGYFAGYSISYTYTEVPFSVMQETLRPTIQDTFFNMKFGDKKSEQVIKSVVGEKGIFVRSAIEDKAKVYIFSDVYFAGQKWDFATIETTLDGRFFFFSVYNTRTDITVERKEANSLYASLKEKLVEKYGKGYEENEDGEIALVLSGGNDVTAVLSNKVGKSTGGTLRRFVTLTYADESINREITEANDSEL